MERDYDLLARLSALPDEVWIGPDEVATLSGLAAVTVQQRRVRGMPSPVSGIRLLRWRLGDVRRWLAGTCG